MHVYLPLGFCTSVSNVRMHVRNIPQWKKSWKRHQYSPVCQFSASSDTSYVPVARLRKNPSDHEEQI